MNIVMILILCLIFGWNIFLRYRYKEKVKELETEKKIREKNESYYKISTLWLKKQIKGKKVSDYCARNQLNRVAIYGMSYMGRCLYESLLDSNIEVAYIIDRQGTIAAEDLPVKAVKPNEYLEEVDGIIVTALPDFLEIEKDLKERQHGVVLPIDDIIYQL